MRWHRVLAWSFLVAFLVLLGFGIVAGTHPERTDQIGLTDALWASAFVGFPTAGALIASRFPRNPLGWLLCVAPVLLMLGVFAGDQAQVLEATGASASSIATWTWLGHVVFELGLGLMALLFLFVPDGRLASKRWRPVAIGLSLTIGLSAISLGIQPGSMMGESIQNPYGLVGAAGAVDAMRAVVGFFFPLLSFLAFLSILVRFRGSTGTERQQLKWLAYGATTMLGILVVLIALETLAGVESSPAITLLFIPAILALPTSMGIAMLRYRLYDVDVVINKTIVYALLSAVLALSYLGIIVVLQGLFGSIVEGSDLAVAASTLAVAALFRPVRSRLQSLIDRSFYRRKYNAAETLSAFSTRLRDQVDLETVRSDIVEVVHETMQPTHASLWLRSGVTE